VTVRGVIGSRGDAVLAGVIGALFLVEILAESSFDSHRAVSIPAALALAATLAPRRRWPLLGMVGGVVVLELSNLAAPPLANTATFVLAYALAIYSGGRYASDRSAVVGAVLVVLSIPLAAIEPGEPFSVSDAAFIAIFFIGPFAVGRVIRRRHARERDLEGLALALEAEARSAVAAERARIARELHDLVSHAISVMVLQARGGRAMLETDRDDARAALDTIERAGEQALAEMRRLLGLLHDGDGAPSLAPQPGLRQLDELVGRLATIGLPVDVTIEGEPIDLPPSIDLSAYRIVQEALTNALKHAGPARAHVTVRYAVAELELEITDDGPGTGNGGGSGRGLAGIRERVAVYGGMLESGPRREGGYALRARLPLGSVG
jgi:signal transduction histidine kinase